MRLAQFLDMSCLCPFSWAREQCWEETPRGPSRNHHLGPPRELVFGDLPHTNYPWVLTQNDHKTSKNEKTVMSSQIQRQELPPLSQTFSVLALRAQTKRLGGRRKNSLLSLASQSHQGIWLWPGCADWLEPLELSSRLLGLPQRRILSGRDDGAAGASLTPFSMVCRWPASHCNFTGLFSVRMTPQGLLLFPSVASSEAYWIGTPF